MDRGSLSFHFGGNLRRVPIVIGIAADIEDATGVGCIALMRAIGSGEARLSVVTEVIGCALRSSGQNFDAATLKKYTLDAGVIAANTIAARILGALLAPPEGKGEAGGMPNPPAGEVRQPS